MARAKLVEYGPGYSPAEHGIVPGMPDTRR